jgi:NADP-dependent 3-hydroxy acid dehydrogenase YdfG
VGEASGRPRGRPCRPLERELRRAGGPVLSVFFVTGGTRGIGRAIAARAADAGHDVFVTGRDEEALASVRGGRVDGCRADVRDWDALQAAVAAARRRFDRIDVAVANAGAGVPGDLASGDPEEWRRMVETNVLGVALTVKACLPELERTRGRIVLIGSVVGRKSVPGSLYGATKWALAGLAESLRLQVREAGIGVTIVEPGLVTSEFWQHTGAAGPPGHALAPEDVAAAVLFAAEQPERVDVNEILLRPRGQAL